MRPFMLAGVAGLAVAGSSALGQSSWLNPVSGLWSGVANWTAGVPNSPIAIANIDVAGIYSVSVDGTFTISTLNLTNPQATVGIANGSLLIVGSGGAVNTGTILVNPIAGPNGTYLQLSASAVFDGTAANPGVLRLNANAGNLDTAYLYASSLGSHVLTNGTHHSLRGTGNVYVAVDNYGSVVADQNGRTLNLFSQNKINRGVLSATSGGILNIQAIQISQLDSAVISNDGGTVNLIGTTVSDGIVQGPSGAVTVAAGANVTFKDSVRSANQLDISNSSGVTINQAGWRHDGTVTVNPSAGPNNTWISFSQSGTVSGNCTIALNANPGNLDTAYLFQTGNSVITLDGTVTLRGTGNVYPAVINNGMIQADVSGRTMVLQSANKTNNATIRAINGGLLYIPGIQITQSAAGLLTSTGTDLTLAGATISGGTVQTSSGAKILVAPGSTVTLKDDVVTSGPLDVSNASGLSVAQPSLLHTGTVTVNPSAGPNNSSIVFNQTGTLGGSGTIVLNANAGNLDTAYLFHGGGVTQTIPAAWTIRGTGNIYVPIVNNSTIQADVAGRTLQFLATGKINNGTIKAINGGLLAFPNITVTQGASGVITSDLADLVLASTTVSGGLVSATGGASLVVSPGSTVTLTGSVTTSGPVNVPNSSALVVNQPSLVHSGTVTVNPTAGPNNTLVNFSQSGTLGGSGTIVLNANAGNLDTAYIFASGGVTQTIPPAWTIRGTGNIYPLIVNNSTIQADVPGRTIQLVGATKTNNGTIRAINGGLLTVSGIQVVQSGSGMLQSNATPLSLNSCSVSGGTIEATGAGSINVGGGVTLNGGVNFFGTLNIPNSQAMVIDQASTLHSGRVTVNTTAGPNGTYLQFARACTIDGGEIVLNANSGNFDTAYLQALAGVTLGGQETLRGRGNLYGNFVNSGTTSPGVTAGAIGRIAIPLHNYTMTDDSVLEIDVGGTADGEFDRVTCGATVAVGGTIRVRLVNGYEPIGGETFDVVTGAARVGSYTYFDIETYPSGAKRFAVKYLPGKVQLMARGCSADFDGSGFVDTDDFTDFVLAFEAGTDDADFDGTGFVDTDDFTAYVHAFEAGC